MRIVSTSRSLLKGSMGTHTGATEVTGPGSVGRVGKGVSAHACSMSAIPRPAGKCASEAGAGGCWTTSEQSMRSLSSWPRRVILRKAAANADWSFAWLSVGGLSCQHGGRRTTVG